jgi:hypothetical protein
VSGGDGSGGMSVEDMMVLLSQCIGVDHNKPDEFGLPSPGFTDYHRKAGINLAPRPYAAF